MSDRLERGARRLAERLDSSGSTAITYRRGSASVALQATLGRQLLSVIDREGNTKMMRADRDFVFAATDLILAGIVTTPKAGDLVDLETAAGVERYEVSPVGSEAPWRYSDPHEVLIRVHTKHVGAGV